MTATHSLSDASGHARRLSPPAPQLSETSLSGVKVVEDKFRGELYGYGQHSYRPPPRGSSGAPSNGIGGGNTVQSHAGMSFHVNGIVNGPGSLALGGVDEGDDDCPPGVADDLGI